jgi:hypothetical protein
MLFQRFNRCGDDLNDKQIFLEVGNRRPKTRPSTGRGIN